MTTQDCGCGCGGRCQGVEVETPLRVNNPPGRSEVSFRTGTHGEFLSSMRARLSSPGYPALSGLTVRSTDDPAIAFLDGWATVGDLLTFYSERIANEGYLRTATQEQSLRLLGRLVGHLPRPGVAAGTYLTYTVDKDPAGGADTVVTIPRGTRAQSVPAQGEQAQPFEISDDLPARWSWNDLQVRLRQPYQVELNKGGQIHLAGTANDVKVGDRLLFVFGADTGQQNIVTVPHVEIDQRNGVTVVGLPGGKDLLALADQLRTRISDAQDYESKHRSRIIQRYLTDVLVKIADDLPTQQKPTSAITNPAQLGLRLDRAIEQLTETEALAEQYPNVHTWLLNELQPKLLDFRATVTSVAPEPPKSVQPLHSELAAASPSSPATLGLGALLGALRTPPSQPPPSPRDLARDPQNIYAPGSDAGVQLLAALDTRLRDNLYQAWQNVDLAVPLELQQLQAMRTVATPFGAMAPLRPRYDAAGRLTGYEDWSLTDTQALELRVDYTSNIPSHAGFTWTQTGGGDQQEVALTATTNTTVNIGPGSIAVTMQPPVPPATQVAGVSFEVRAQLPQRTVTMSSVGTNGATTVKITGKDANGNDLTPVTFQLFEGGSGFAVQHDLVIIANRNAITGGGTVDLTLHTFIPDNLRNVITLDAQYDGIGPGSWVVIERPGKTTPSGKPQLSSVITQVRQSRVVSRSDFGITGKVTELTLAGNWLDEQDVVLSAIRNTTVYTRGVPLTLATEPVTGDVAGDEIELGQLYQGLTAGRWLVVTGERTDIPHTPGVTGTELTMIAAVEQFVDKTRPGDTVHTRIKLAARLAYRYKRDTVHLYANVGAATNGASRDEPIGSGDASKRNQTFTLFQKPVTWLAADTPLGAASTLQVRVDGVLWSEVDSLAGRGPAEKVYTTAVDETGTTSVTFGDGINGARLPTGTQNVRAAYRVGVGKAANVAVGKISQLVTRPLWVSGVNNPLAATGGADPDDAGQARRTIPLSVTALDRLVSVPDYEDFARNRAGIGRASARRLSDGARQIVHVTVAGMGDIPLTDSSGIVTTLRSSLVDFGDPQLPVEVAVRELVLLVMVANIKVDATHSWQLVEPAVRAALLDRLGFDRRELGQPAYLSEAISAAQSVPGVDYVDIDVFAGVPGSLTPADLDTLASKLTAPQSAVPARLAKLDVTRYTVQADSETLTQIAATNGISVDELFRLNPDLTSTDPLSKGRSVVVFRGVRPAQLVLLSPDVPDTLILKEVRP